MLQAMVTILLFDSGLNDVPTQLARGLFALHLKGTLFWCDFWENTEVGVAAEHAWFTVAALFEGNCDRVLLEKLVGGVSFVRFEYEEQRFIFLKIVDIVGCFCLSVALEMVWFQHSFLLFFRLNLLCQLFLMSAALKPWGEETNCDQ